MLSVIYALVAALVAGAASIPFVGWIGAIVPSLVTFVVVALVLLRRANTRVRTEMGAIQAMMMQKNVDLALQALESIRQRYSKWIFMLGAQIDGQIGSIYYLRKDFDKARPYLERAFIRMWEPKLMLACLLSGELKDGNDKKKGDKGEKGNLAAVDQLLERVVKYTPKAGLLWSTWAWLHWKAGNAQKAIGILARGKKILGESDPVLSQNLLALQNDKKMKMKGYGDQWYAFHLEQHPMVMQAQRGGNVRFARR